MTSTTDSEAIARQPATRNVVTTSPRLRRQLPAAFLRDLGAFNSCNRNQENRLSERSAEKKVSAMNPSAMAATTYMGCSSYPPFTRKGLVGVRRSFGRRRV